MILTEVREARPHGSRQPTICRRFQLQNTDATVLQRHWVTLATMLLYAMNVICLPDRALTGDFGTGIARFSPFLALVAIYAPQCPSPEAFVGGSR